MEDNDSEDSYTRNSEQEIKTQANSSWNHWRVNASCDHLKADVLRMRTLTEKKRTESLTPVKRQGAIIMLVSFELFVFTKWREASKVWQCNLKYKTSSLSLSLHLELLLNLFPHGRWRCCYIFAINISNSWIEGEWCSLARHWVKSCRPGHSWRTVDGCQLYWDHRQSTRAVTILLCLLHPGPCKEMSGDHTTSLPRDRRGKKVLAHTGVSLKQSICLFRAWC